MMIPDSAREVLTSNRLAHLVTIEPDGSPQVTCAWVGMEDEEIVIATLPEQRKLRNIRRDERVALSIETSKLNPYGLTEYLVVYGGLGSPREAARSCFRSSPTGTSGRA
jgi:PPOX class probable F420-dependent enzyme